MSVGILLVTHANIGHSMLEAARMILGGKLPTTVRSLAIDALMQPEIICTQITAACQQLAQEHGSVLILTDVYGATPSKFACAMSIDYPSITVSGISLPMLLKVINYAPQLELDALAQKAVDGGHQGIKMTGQTETN